MICPHCDHETDQIKVIYLCDNGQGSELYTVEVDDDACVVSTPVPDNPINAPYPQLKLHDMLCPRCGESLIADVEDYEGFID